MAKVRKFEDGLKLSIRSKIVGLLLQDMDLMVKTNMVIKREVDDARSIRHAGVKDKRMESQSSSSSSRKEAEDLYSARVSGTGPRLSRPRLGSIILGWERFQGS